jgi:eukaryotic-like serine/threonine-protein kinase
LQTLAPRVLIISDQYDFGRLLEQHLSITWPDIETKIHEPRYSGKLHPAFVAAGFDCALIDHEILGGQGLEWFDDLRSRKLFPPILYFCHSSDNTIGERVLRDGAAEWFVRERIHNRRLVSVVENQITRRRKELVMYRARPEAVKQTKFGPITIRGQRFISELASGGSSKVYLAESEKAGEMVVLKVLGDRDSTVPHSNNEAHKSFERFLQEYEVLLRIRHPNVVRIHELGIADDHAYIAMEYFPAGDLRARMTGPIAPDKALEYTAQIARALSAVHQVGVLHRDLKPGNVMLRNDSTVALIDFGLAKHSLRSIDITAAGTIFGTPYYISPEQGHGDPVDERSDIYSLGVMLYEMLMHKKPYTASTPMGIIYMHRNGPLPQLPEELSRYQSFLHRLMAKDPGHRYQTAEEVLDALQAYR